MTDDIQRADYDSPWKNILESYFREALEFFFPKTAAIIDWSVPPVFLNKEFQAISHNAEQGRRYADELVQVRSLSGKDIWLFIHVEIQGQEEDEFPLRIFTYNFRILDYFKKSATSLAVLCDSNSKWHPKTYSFSYPDTDLRFKFGTFKLLKYQRRWKELEASNNVFATVTMAHLKAQQTSKNPKQRKDWKFTLIRRLYDRGLSEQDIRNLYKFIDWVMILPEGLENEFWQDYKKLEQERSMTYITSVERIGIKRGKLEQAKSLVLRLLNKRLGESQQNREVVESLTLEQLDALGEALLDFTSTDDLLHWLQQNQHT